MDAVLELASRQDGYHQGLVIDDRYRLLRRLEEGGMSWVWLAHHLALDTAVAVKISKTPTRRPAVEAAQEGRIIAALRHSAIVTVLDSGRTQWGDPFVVMELLDGCSLAQSLARDQRLPPQAAVTLLLPVLDALSTCHERGLLHGDIKPANIFLARQNGVTRAKLLDFGVARPIASASGVPWLTGTPGYMAPEQVEQAPIDQRADVWAACAVLYEAISGRPVVVGKSCAALLTATLALDVEPLAERIGGESSLWPILERGLRSAPMERFPTMHALACELAAWSSEQAGAIEREAHVSATSASAPCALEGANAEPRSGVRTRRPIDGDTERVTDARALYEATADAPLAARQRRPLQWYGPVADRRRSPLPRGLSASLLALLLAVMLLLGLSYRTLARGVQRGAFGTTGTSAARVLLLRHQKALSTSTTLFDEQSYKAELGRDFALGLTVAAS